MTDWIALEQRFSEDRSAPMAGPLRARFVEDVEVGLCAPEDVPAVAVAAARSSPGLMAVTRGIRDGYLPSLFSDRVSRVLADPTWVALLERAPLPDLDLERLMCAVRRTLLRAWSEGRFQGPPCPEATRLLFASAAYFARAEYVQHTEDLEDVLVEDLGSRVAGSSGETDVEAILVGLLACYRPLHELPNASTLVEAAAAPGREALAALLSWAVTEPLQQARYAASLPSFGKLADPRSAAVRVQYEENPYPRWQHLAPYPPRPIHELIQDQVGATAPVTPSMDHPSVLVAGCGTGRHALACGRYYRGARVVGVDLSRASLGYAESRRRRLGLDNVRFIQGDLLELDALGESFDVVECVGTLHHMDDPGGGWRVVQRRLRPGGVMKVGLYSATARGIIPKIREIAEAEGVGRNERSLRGFRRALAEGKVDLPSRDLRPVLESPDFFTMSGYRDLLFHVHEHPFDLASLARAVADSGLTFLGFIVGPRHLRAYRRIHGEQRSMRDIASWGPVEEAVPHLFGGMYRFWLRHGPPG